MTGLNPWCVVALLWAITVVLAATHHYERRTPEQRRIDKLARRDTWIYADGKRVPRLKVRKAMRSARRGR